MNESQQERLFLILREETIGKEERIFLIPSAALKNKKEKNANKGERLIDEIKIRDKKLNNSLFYDN